LGVLSADQARTELELSQIMVATSDRNEGWGAVINEGMASGCAVVASHLMGSVPYLINDGENGLVFESGNADDLYEKVEYLLTNQDVCRNLSTNAYNTVSENWNGKTAAEKLCEVFRAYLNGNTAFAYDSGICSHAQRYSDHWFKRLHKEKDN
jgi:glycosyltransferase involved in cell wall biosynthesis